MIKSESLGKFRIGIREGGNTRWINWCKKDDKFISKEEIEFYPGDKIVVSSDQNSYKDDIYAMMGWSKAEQIPISTDFKSDSALLKLTQTGRNEDNEFSSYWESKEKCKIRGRRIQVGFGSFARSNWGIGRIQFALFNSTGFPLRRPDRRPLVLLIKTGHRGWIESANELIKQDLTVETQSDVTSSVVGVTPLSTRRESIGQGGVSKALREYTILEDLLVELKQCLRAICSNPRKSLTRRRYREVNRSTSDRVRSESKVQKVNSYTRSYRKGASAQRVTLSNIERDIDSTPNRFARWVSHNISKTLTDLEGEISEYIDKLERHKVKFERRRSGDKYKTSTHWRNISDKINSHTGAINKIKTLKRDIAGAGNFLKERGVKIEKKPNNIRQKRIDSRYQRLIKISSKINKDIEVDKEKRYNKEIRQKPINELYEIWSFKKTYKAILNSLDGVLVGKKKEVKPYGIPMENEKFCTMESNLIEGLEVVLWFDKRIVYNEKPNEHYGILENKNDKHRPDIMAEFWHKEIQDGNRPLLAVFDPTTSKSKHALNKKYDYMENIKSFDKDPEGKHIPIVASSWAIYPGTKNGRNFAKGGASRAPWSNGKLVLHPKRKDHFNRIVKKIIFKNIIV